MVDKFRARDRDLHLRLSDIELITLERKARELNVSKSTVLRLLIMDGMAARTTNFSTEETKALLFELNRIGNNINQIAYRVNAKNLFGIDEVEHLKHLYEGVLDAFSKHIMR